MKTGKGKKWKKTELGGCYDGWFNTQSATLPIIILLLLVAIVVVVVEILNIAPQRMNVKGKSCHYFD